MSHTIDDFNKNVFINCPFDQQFLPLLHALLFTVVFLRHKPRIALERSDSGEQRITKLLELINESQLSIHDLSRIQAEEKGDYSRLNMPLELGIDYGARHFGDPRLNTKRFLVLSTARYEYLKAVSDLAGI